MHAAAYHFVADIVRPLRTTGLRVLEIGSQDVNGSVRRLFAGAEYIGIDRCAGPGVDVVADAREYDGQATFDVVISTEALEHDPEPQTIIDCAWRALKPGGLLLVTAASPERLPHSWTGESLVPGEPYAGISAERMHELLATWHKPRVLSYRQHGDTYAVASKPAPEVIPLIIPTLDVNLGKKLPAQLGTPGVEMTTIIVYDEKQQGFTRAVNAGLRMALDDRWSYVGILSDDCRPATQNWLLLLRQALEGDAQNGFAAPLMPCRTEGIVGIEPAAETKIVGHWAVPYGCVLIRREALRDVGLLDPLMAHYASDTDHQLRARAFGWKSVVCHHVWVDRELHPPREPQWSKDRAVFFRRWAGASGR